MAKFVGYFANKAIIKSTLTSKVGVSIKGFAELGSYSMTLKQLLLVTRVFYLETKRTPMEVFMETRRQS